MEDDFNDLSGMFPTLEGYAVLTEEQIKYMRDRFLHWKLPADFKPDCGIHFDADAAKKINPRNQRYEPVGTNLFTATEAEAMVRFMVEGMPAAITKSE